MRLIALIATLYLASACQVRGEDLSDSDWEVVKDFPMTTTTGLSTSYAWRRDQVINNELGYYADGTAATIQSDTLVLTASATPVADEASSADQPFITGVVTTADEFTQLEGRVDFGLQFSGAVGSRVVATLDSGAVRDANRIVVAGGSQDATAGVYQVGIGKSLTTVRTASDLTESVNSYSVVIDDTLVIWYFNGGEVHRAAKPRTLTDPRYAAVGHSVGGNYSQVVRSGDFPAFIVVDYVRFQVKPTEESDPISSAAKTVERTDNETPITWEGLIRIISHLRDIAAGKG